MRWHVRLQTKNSRYAAAAARRQVDVRLLAPIRSNEPLIGHATRSDYSEPLRAGIKIYEWLGKILHAKMENSEEIELRRWQRRSLMERIEESIAGCLEPLL